MTMAYDLSKIKGQSPSRIQKWAYVPWLICSLADYFHIIISCKCHQNGFTIFPVIMFTNSQINSGCHITSLLGVKLFGQAALEKHTHTHTQRKNVSHCRRNKNPQSLCIRLLNSDFFSLGFWLKCILKIRCGNRHEPTLNSLYQCRAEMSASSSGSNNISKELLLCCAAAEKEVRNRKKELNIYVKNGCFVF